MEFERNWRRKLKKSIKRGPDASDGMALYKSLDRDALLWTKAFMKAAADRYEEEELKRLLLSCACRYPKEKLKELRGLYEVTGNLAIVHGLLQAKFEEEIKTAKGLDKADLAFFREKGWGLAGVLNGREIVATKIPADFQAWREAETCEKRAEAYCHCPRIRRIFKEGGALDHRYCYCGGGYYKALWEDITGKPVRIEILKSLLKGDGVCSFKVMV